MILIQNIDLNAIEHEDSTRISLHRVSVGYAKTALKQAGENRNGIVLINSDVTDPEIAKVYEYELGVPVLSLPKTLVFSKGSSAIWGRIVPPGNEVGSCMFPGGPGVEWYLVEID